MITVSIPEQLKRLTGGQTDLSVASATNITDLVNKLDAQHTGLKERVLNNRFLLFFVNGEDIRFLQGNNTVLNDGDEISIVAAVAGG